MSKTLFKFLALIVLLSNPLSASGQATNVTNAVFDAGTGAFSVTGTEGADSIVITVSANDIVEVGNVASGVNAGDVTTISVDGLGGNDLIDLSRVLASDFSGISSDAGAITIEGGFGNDTIFGSGLDDTIRGGAGDDFIYGDQLAGNQDGLVLGFEEVAPDVLGGSNNDRTKDAEIADIDNDGDLDIYDANSNVPFGSDALVIRFNDGVGGFTDVRVAPNDGATTYDSDLADLNGDGFPDLIRTQGGQVGVYLNQRGVGGVWFNLDRNDPANLPFFFVDAPGDLPDDIAVADLDNDGDLDFAVAMRDRGSNQGSGVEVYINDGAPNFSKLDQGSLDNFVGSTHDVFFVDANADGHLDIVAVNETSGTRSRLFLNDGNANLSFTLDESQDFQGRAFSGASADFNGDGYEDLVFTGSVSSVYLNDPDDPGRFQAPETLPGSQFLRFYDVEIGDIDNDGDLDAVSPVINGTSRIWLNDGVDANGDFRGFTLFGSTNPLPGLAAGSVLSADMIDYDFDGDLDVYIAGDDNGRSRNQFFANTQIQYGNDHLEGGPGNDAIYGGAGNDTIFGGAGGGDSIVGDVSLNGQVDFGDIGPFIAVLQSGIYQFEADVDRNGVVNFSDIAPFIPLIQNGPLVDGDDVLVGGAGADMITGGDGNDTFFGFRAAVGDVNLDGQVNFSDIASFSNLVQAGAYRFEADIDGNREVNDLDETPFITLLSGGAQAPLRDGADDTIVDQEANDILFDDE